MEFSRDSIDVTKERLKNATMASPEFELTDEAASPVEGQISSPQSFASFDDQRASFRSPITSPRLSDSPLQPTRSRGGSLSSVLSESLGRLFRSSKRKPKRNKVYRDKTARPLQPDILDKPVTGKLTKFWGSVHDRRSQDSPSRSAIELSQLGPPLPEFPNSLGISLGGTSLRLPAIAEHSPKQELSFRTRTPAMDSSRLTPDSIQQGEKKQKAIQDAKDMHQLVRRNCERANIQVPPYDFLELIGKGAFGRVYKCKERSSGNLVAIKIVNTDEVDYQQDSLDKDDTIRDFRKEVTILQQLKDNNARNVNMIHDAFDLQEQLWIVSDYCTGGSIRTLMRAQPASQPGLEEQYIIPIARELGFAMKSVHDIGVIHRDIKCTNVYVTEDGEIQLGDFGIVGVMDDGVSKRQTMIGTPHYMPREMLIHGSGNQVAEAYGTEIDVWSYGCSVYEMATGQPPNAVKRQDTLRNELLNAPRLEGGKHSQELRDFVAFCLNSDPKERPTADQVLRHPYLANTQKRYPTRTLVELIHRYKKWEFGGGWRQSLFFAGGAAPVAGTNEQVSETAEQEFDDWNFSTSDSFNAAFERRYSQLLSSDGPESLRIETQDSSSLPPLDTNLTPFERIQQRQNDLSASRGERSLDRIFTPESQPYELHAAIEDEPSPDSDLPFRSKFAAGAPTRESHVMIDLDTGGDEDIPTYNFDFGDDRTLKAGGFRTSSQHDEEEEDSYQYGLSEDDREKRQTMEWKFPAVKRVTMDWKFPSTQTNELDPEAPPRRPSLKHTATEPIGQFGDYMHPAPRQLAHNSPIRESMTSMIDLDLGLSDPAEIIRPSTASSATGSTMTDATSGNPFDLEDDPAQSERERNRFSYHKQWQSEGGQLKRSSYRSMPMHTRGTSLSSSASEMERAANIENDDVFNFDYSRSISESMRHQLNGTLPHHSIDLDQWPDFGPTSGFDRMRSWADPLDEMVAQQRGPDGPQTLPGHINGDGFKAVGQERPILQFPKVSGPHPDALLEETDPNILMQEFDRLLGDLGEGLRVTANAFQQLAGDDDRDRGFDTTDSETGDETKYS